MKTALSGNFNERAASSTIDYIVIHYTGMRDAESAVARLCDREAQVSAHYVIDEDGEVIQLVSDEKRAWHAGKSFWRGCTDMNSASVGIELVNPGHEFGYRPFPEMQMLSLKSLLNTLIERHRMNAKTCLLAHSDIAPERKQDPGELFPWQEFSQEGLGVWPQLTDHRDFSQSSTATILEEIGYNVSHLQKTVSAFQRRFYPDNISGTADIETCRRMISIRNLLSA